MGLVCSGFMGHLSASGFGDVCKWLTSKDIQIIPAFFGPNDYGHWTALIVDTNTNEPKPVVAFVDSLSDRENRFQVLKRDLKDTYYDEPFAKHVLIDSPFQDANSNDCAFFTIGAFAQWVLRATRDVPTKFALPSSCPSSRYGIEMRRHVYMSIMNREVDLEAPILSAMVIS